MSEKLRHFPQNDPKPSTENTSLRDEIRSHIDAFLAKGGTIQQCTPKDNHAYRESLIKRTRKQQLKYNKRFSRVLVDRRK